jgi:hypothetical protein
MNRIKLAVGIILLLLLGAAAGSVGTGIYVRHRIENISPGKPPKAHFLLRKLSRELDLTESQKVEIGKILEESHAEITALRRRFLPEIKEITDQSFGRIEEELNEEQKRKLGKLHRRLKRWRNRRHFPPPPIEKSPQQIFSDMSNRLKLSEKQASAVRPIVVKGMEAQHALHEHYKERRRLERKALRTEIRRQQEFMEESLDTLLTAEQMKQFRKLQKERRRQINSDMRLHPSDRLE